MDIQMLREWIESSIKNIKDTDKLNGQSSGVLTELRNLQLRLKPLILSNVDPETKFISYFLSCYVDSVLMDLCGDTPDDSEGILKKVRNDLFINITATFEKLTLCLQNKENPLPIFEDFVSIYTQAVNKINYLDNQLENGGHNEWN